MLKPKFPIKDRKKGEKEMKRKEKKEAKEMLNVDRKCKNKQTLVHKKWNAQKVERKEENEKKFIVSGNFSTSSNYNLLDKWPQ